MSTADELRLAMGQLDKLLARRRFLLAIGSDFTGVTFEIMALREVIRSLEENTIEQRWMQ